MNVNVSYVIKNNASHPHFCPTRKALKKLQNNLSKEDFHFVLFITLKDLFVPLGEFHRFEELFPDWWKYKKKE